MTTKKCKATTHEKTKCPWKATVLGYCVNHYRQKVEIENKTKQTNLIEW